MLLEYSTPEQLTTVIDDAIWKKTDPGVPETFDPDEFLDWIQALLDVNDDFAVERLSALNEDLIVMAFMRYLRIEDLDKRILDAETYVKTDFMMPDSAGMTELCGPFEIRPRIDNHWEVIQPLIAALRTVDPEYLEMILTRCCLPESLLQFRDNRSAALDAAGDRMERREREGFVNPETAGAFLCTARDESASRLAAETEYDLDAQRYFELIRRTALETILESGRRKARQIGHDDRPDDDEAAAPPADPEDLNELDELVASVETAKLHDPMKLLAGPEADTENPLHTALQDSDAASAAQRMNEVSYLSNLLMAGVQARGKWLEHNEAVAAVMATCSLGYQMYPQFDVCSEPGLIGVFRIGWNTVQRLPREVVRQLVPALTSPGFTASLGPRAWIVEDVVSAIQATAIQADMELGQYDSVQELLQMLSLVLEEHAVDYLVRIVDGFPTIQRSDGYTVQQGLAFIESRTDLTAIGGFLSGLSNQVKRKG